ncbi:MAG: hypothetical protein M3O31_10645, partial [Acidobacteriota bacterium]|nr:hypothetical protein [Acidobacteriota bacterium]
MSKRFPSTSTLALLASLVLSAPTLPAQSAALPMVIDASAPAVAPGPANYTYDPADAKSPDGHTIGLNS